MRSFWHLSIQGVWCERKSLAFWCTRSLPDISPYASIYSSYRSVNSSVALVHLLGFLAGIVLHALLGVMTLRSGRGAIATGASDRIPLATSCLGLRDRHLRKRPHERGGHHYAGRTRALRLQQRHPRRSELHPERSDWLQLHSRSDRRSAERRLDARAQSRFA
jgi:hypothetical protein